jgi:methionyl-tRNA formyltransferase
MISTLAGLTNNAITPRPQDDAHATLAPILKREDGLIDFSRTAVEAWNRLRGFQPWPGAFTRFRGKALQIHSATPAPEVAVIAAAHFTVENERLLVGFAHGTALDVHELQVEGKKRMSAHDFINGYRPGSEETLG